MQESRIEKKNKRVKQTEEEKKFPLIRAVSWTLSHIHNSAFHQQQGFGKKISMADSNTGDLVQRIKGRKFSPDLYFYK